MHELAAWLFDQIAITTELERLDYIAEVIAFDKQMDAVYLSDPKVLGILRRAWAEKRSELTIDSEQSIDNSADVVTKTTQIEDLSGQPA